MKEKPETKYNEEKNSSYVRYLSDAIKELTDAGHKLPVLKKVTGSQKKCQVNVHLHIWDALQGYWERNRKTYVHRAKSDYRALYLGTILILEEESALAGRDNDEGICKLKTWIEAKKYKHAVLEKVALMRSEVKQLLVERDNDVITHDDFISECMEMLNTFEREEEKMKAAILMDKLIEEETVRLKNRKYQQKHRELEKKLKGIKVVEDSQYTDT